MILSLQVLLPLTLGAAAPGGRRWTVCARVLPKPSPSQVSARLPPPGRDFQKEEPRGLERGSQRGSLLSASELLCPPEEGRGGRPTKVAWEGMGPGERVRGLLLGLGLGSTGRPCPDEIPRFSLR